MTGLFSDSAGHPGGNFHTPQSLQQRLALVFCGNLPHHLIPSDGSDP